MHNLDLNNIKRVLILESQLIFTSLLLYLVSPDLTEIIQGLSTSMGGELSGLIVIIALVSISFLMTIGAVLIGNKYFWNENTFLLILSPKTKHRYEYLYVAIYLGLHYGLLTNYQLKFAAETIIQIIGMLTVFRLATWLIFSFLMDDGKEESIVSIDTEVGSNESQEDFKSKLEDYPFVIKLALSRLITGLGLGFIFYLCLLVLNILLITSLSATYNIFIQAFPAFLDANNLGIIGVVVVTLNNLLTILIRYSLVLTIPFLSAALLLVLFIQALRLRASTDLKMFLFLIVVIWSWLILLLAYCTVVINSSLLEHLLAISFQELTSNTSMPASLPDIFNFPPVSLLYLSLEIGAVLLIGTFVNEMVDLKRQSNILELIYQEKFDLAIELMHFHDSHRGKLYRLKLLLDNILINHGQLTIGKNLEKINLYQSLFESDLERISNLVREILVSTITSTILGFLAWLLVFPSLLIMWIVLGEGLGLIVVILFLVVMILVFIHSLSRITGHGISTESLICLLFTGAMIFILREWILIPENIPVMIYITLAINIALYSIVHVDQYFLLREKIEKVIIEGKEGIINLEPAVFLSKDLYKDSYHHRLVKQLFNTISNRKIEGNESNDIEAPAGTVFFDGRIVDKSEAELLWNLEMKLGKPIYAFNRISDLYHHPVGILIVDERVHGISLKAQNLNELPLEIYKFKQLEILALDDNKLTIIQNMGNIGNIKELYLNGNKIGPVLTGFPVMKACRKGYAST